MTDIVERLRELEQVEHELAHDCDYPPEATANWKYAETCREAAAEIERLRAALREIVILDDEPQCCGRGIAGYDNPPECCGDPERGIDRAQSVARAALEGKHD